MSKHRKGPFEGKRGISVEVRNENVEGAIRLLTRKLKQEGLLRELRVRQFYEKPSAKRRKAESEAQSRWKKQSDRLKGN